MWWTLTLISFLARSSSLCSLVFSDTTEQYNQAHNNDTTEAKGLLCLGPRHKPHSHEDFRLHTFQSRFESGVESGCIQILRDRK